MTARITLKRVLAPFLFSLLLLLSASSVLAQDATSSSAAAKPRREVVQNRPAIAPLKVEQRKENIQEKIAATREKIASKEAALKLRLEKFKDQKKAQITERVSMNLNKINEKMTMEMSSFLQRITALLDKLEARVLAGTPDITDPEAAKVEIALARASVVSAQEAVTLQAGKDYTLTGSSEARVKIDANNMRKQLHTDLQALRKIIVETKQAALNALKVAKLGSKEATVSGQQ